MAMVTTRIRSALLVVLAAAAVASAQPAWIARSNENAQILLTLNAKYGPEGAARQGVSGLDEAVTQLASNRRESVKADTRAALAELRKRLAAETDPLVAQDLQILVKAAQAQLDGLDLSEKYDIPYINVPALVFSGVRALLDDQIPEARRKAALVRLRKYAGLEPGFEPLTEQAKARNRDWRRPGQVGPAKIEIETNLARGDFFINGIAELFARYKIDGYEEPFAKLKQQLADYQAWTRREMLPAGRDDFRLPPDKYAFSLRQYGVDLPATELVKVAHASFDQWQREAQQIAARIAKDRGWAFTDYREVMRELKKDQLSGDAILPHYQARLKEIEAIIAREQLVTLPARPARIRIATAAETAQQPAPHMEPPPLMNNTGQQGAFVLPLAAPTANGSTAPTNDFTFAAMSWTLTAHEARPGHELQFASMVEHGVSLARALYAFNSANVEGWGLYAEHILKPFEPLDGQLFTLQSRMLRAARAFIDPELESGTLTPAQGKRVLTDDVMLSDAFAGTEIERYTFQAPGQATSYFYGYLKLLELRKDVESKMGARFDQRTFHDFILAQGLLPPDLLRQAVLDDFVGAGVK
jgi:hypothetical protein